MLVPETSMDEDNLATTNENQIGASWESVDVQPVAETHSMDQPANRHFGLHVFTAYRAHHLAAFFWRNFVHRLPSLKRAFYLSAKRCLGWCLFVENSLLKI